MLHLTATAAEAAERERERAKEAERPPPGLRQKKQQQHFRVGSVYTIGLPKKCTVYVRTLDFVLLQGEVTVDKLKLSLRLD